MSSYAVKGGIGDFLQCLPFMLANPDAKFYVASHYDGVLDFFEAFGLRFSVWEVPLGRMPAVKECPRELFFRYNPFPSPPPRHHERPVIGVHLGGSTYSLSVEERFGFPPKALPRSILDGIVESTPHEVLLFGSPKELAALGAIDERVRAASGGLVAALSRVAECSVLVGSDSAFKTMSAMLRIPTVVLMGDYRDDHRDSRFIDPYVVAGVMSTFRYRDLTREAEEAIKFCVDRILTATTGRCLRSGTN